MNKNICKLIIASTCLFVGQQSQAQTVGDRMHIGLSLGATKYKGDVNKSTTNASFSGYLSYELTDQIQLRGQALLTSIGAGVNKNYTYATQTLAESASYFDDNFFFKSKIQDFSLQFVYDFFNVNASARFTPYLFAGIGIVHFNPYLQYYSTETQGQRINKYYYQPFNNPGTTYSNTAFQIPLGVGIKYNISHNTRLFLEYSNHISNDNVDHIYRGGKHDRYQNISLGISFRLGKDGAGDNSQTGGSSKGYRTDCPPVY